MKFFTPTVIGRTVAATALTLVCKLMLFATAMAGETITLQSTTSTRDSGLYDFVLPKFSAATGINARVVAVGTGQAIRNARDCNGDVLLVHSRPDEEKFVADGFGVKRYDLMYNDFVIIGPKSDPAGISGKNNVLEALHIIFEKQAKFASRGDDSGTHKAELRLWQKAQIDPIPHSGDWYLETGTGMGKTLNVAIGKNAYVMSDRATWIKYGNKQGHEVVVEDDPPLFNQYGIVAVSQDKCPDANRANADKLINWLLSPSGQNAIGDYRIDGVQVFFPNAGNTTN